MNRKQKLQAIRKLAYVLDKYEIIITPSILLNTIEIDIMFSDGSKAETLERNVSSSVLYELINRHERED